MRNLRHVVILVVAVLSLLVFAACSGEKATIPDVAVGAADYSFTAPDSISGGLTRLRLSNSGAESHHAQLARLNDGVTMQQLQGALQQSPEAALALVELAGGPSGIYPGGQSEAIVDLQPGQYVMVCFISSPDGTPHIAKGMLKPLTVTAAPATRPAPPKAARTVSLNDFAFGDMPASVSNGKTTFEVANKGKEPHEMTLLSLKVPADQARQILSAPPPPPGTPPPAGPPPFEDAGGFQAIAPGKTGWATVDLKAGEYALVCFVPSPARGGKPHVALGMFRPFSVR